MWWERQRRELRILEEREEVLKVEGVDRGAKRGRENGGDVRVSSGIDDADVSDNRVRVREVKAKIRAVVVLKRKMIVSGCRPFQQ